MRLLTCHIENFGKLSDFSYDFADGYNAFVLPNGAGKSTFAAFIRVMFYGFAGETKRTELEKERKRYQPWQGGTYGGQLTFTADGNIICCRVSSGRRQREIPSGYRMRIRCLTVQISPNRSDRNYSESMRSLLCGPSISDRRNVRHLQRQTA